MTEVRSGKRGKTSLALSDSSAFLYPPLTLVIFGAVAMRNTSSATGYCLGWPTSEIVVLVYNAAA